MMKNPTDVDWIEIASANIAWQTVKVHSITYILKWTHLVASDAIKMIFLSYDQLFTTTPSIIKPKKGMIDLGVEGEFQSHIGWVCPNMCPTAPPAQHCLMTFAQASRSRPWLEQSLNQAHVHVASIHVRPEIKGFSQDWRRLHYDDVCKSHSGGWTEPTSCRCRHGHGHGGHVPFALCLPGRRKLMSEGSRKITDCVPRNYKHEDGFL